MIEIVAVQFKNASRIYYFSPGELHFQVGDYCIVETVRGLELAKIVIPNRMIEEDKLEYELKPVLRRAYQKDLDNDKRHEEMAKTAFETFKEDVTSLDLEMKPLYAEYTIDGSKLLFYYTSEDRVDFRDLLKLLTPKFHVRIELRQIGAREAARIIGGIGNCGRIVCCKSCLNDFDFVSMKMAKEQSLSLNVTKISGLCGKLMCCIAFENELYKEAKAKMPAMGSYVKTPTCEASKVVALDCVKMLVSCQDNPDVMPVKYTLEDLGILTLNNPDIDEGVEEVDVAEVELEEVVEEELVEESPKAKKIYTPFKASPKGKKKNGKK